MIRLYPGVNVEHEVRVERKEGNCAFETSSQGRRGGGWVVMPGFESILYMSQAQTPPPSHGLEGVGLGRSILFATTTEVRI